MISLICYVGLLLPLQASPPAEDVAPQVRRLVRLLNSDELTERDQAERQLVELGPAALAHLPPVSDRTPAETVQRLTRVRQALQEQQSKQAAQGSTVTLHGSHRLSEILKSFGEQTGNKIVGAHASDDDEDEKPADPELKVDFDATPFWQALDEVLDRANLDIDNYTGETGIVVAPRAAGRRPRGKTASYNGPFRVEPVRFEALRDLRDPKNESLKLFIDVSWESRLKPIVVVQPLDQISARAGDKALAVAGQGEPAAPLGDTSAAVELEIPLTPPPRSVKKLSSVTGQLKVLVPGEVETFRFKDLPVGKEAAAKKLEQRKAAVTVIVDGLRKNNDVWELRMRVRFDDASYALDSYLGSWLLSNEAVLEKKGEEPIHPGGLEQTRQTPTEIGVAYLYELPDGPKGWEFVYKTPTVVFDLPVKYEFKDLELP